MQSKLPQIEDNVRGFFPVKENAGLERVGGALASNCKRWLGHLSPKVSLTSAAMASSMAVDFLFPFFRALAVAPFPGKRIPLKVTITVAVPLLE